MCLGASFSSREAENHQKSLDSFFLSSQEDIVLYFTELIYFHPLNAYPIQRWGTP